MTSALLSELILRSAALLLAGEVILLLLRRSSAALRHRFLLGVLALLALLPVLAAVLPEMPLAWWAPRHAQVAVVTIAETSKAVAKTGRPPADWLFRLWILGAMAALLPLVRGAFSAWRIARRARPWQDGISFSSELRVPLTCGIVRRRILLPADAERWSPTRLRAVLLHERAHVRRRDVAIQMVAHVVAAAWWFQPLVWVLRRRLRTESEFACDAEAVRSGVRRSEYASELVAIAKSVGSEWRMSSSALAMVRSNDLEDRVRAVLLPSHRLLLPATAWMFGLLLGGAAMAASAVTFHSRERSSEQSFSESGGSIMKRTMLSALLTSAGLSAATISGTVHDVNGAAVTDAKVTIDNPDTSAKQEAFTGSNGKFSLSPSGAGQYILRIEKPGFTSVFREFNLKADASTEREFTMPAEGAQATPDKMVAANEAQPATVRVGGEVAQTNLLQKVQPVYPAAAKTAHTQGTVEIEASISEEGVPLELRVQSSPSDDLSASALEAVRQWRYQPTLLNGVPTAIVTTVVVNYTLSK